MLIEIGDSYYDIPDGWHDLVLADFIQVAEFSEKAPEDNATEAEKFDYYINYISLFGIPKESLKNIKLFTENDQEFGVINLFNHLWQFAQMPTDDFMSFKMFILGRDTYLFNTNSLDLTGGMKPMADYTFQEFEEANGIMQAMNYVKEGKLEHLALLCAIFFRPVIRKKFQYFRKLEIEPYDEVSVKDRAELFKYQLPMDKVFKAYFFLLSQIAISNVDTANSLLEEVEKSLA